MKILCFNRVSFELDFISSKWDFPQMDFPKSDSELIALVVLGLSCEYVFCLSPFLSNWIFLPHGILPQMDFPQTDSELLA